MAKKYSSIMLSMRPNARTVEKFEPEARVSPDGQKTVAVGLFTDQGEQVGFLTGLNVMIRELVA